MSLAGLFQLFAMVSFLTFGGGYAMIPLFQAALVTSHHFMTAEEFANLVALAQVTPGPVGLNAATYIGFVQQSYPGAFAATLGAMTPSLTLVAAVAVCLYKYKDHFFVKSLLSGIRPVTLGLIAAAVIFFAETSVFTAPLSDLWKEGGGNFGICWQGGVIFLLSLILAYRKINILLILFLAAGLGWLLL